MKISRLISLSLNLSANYLEQPGIREKGIEALYLLKYRQQKSDVGNGIFGTGEHSDYDLFTILLFNSNPGLQVLHNDKWIDIEYQENALIVNIADTLQNGPMIYSPQQNIEWFLMESIIDIQFLFVAANYDLDIDCLPNTVIVDDEKYAQCNHGQLNLENIWTINYSKQFLMIKVFIWNYNS